MGHWHLFADVNQLQTAMGFQNKMSSIDQYMERVAKKLVIMMTSSNGNIFRVTGPLCGEFTGPGEFPTQRPVTRSFDVYFDLRLNKRLCKQSWGWWFQTLLCPLWGHSNVYSTSQELWTWFVLLCSGYVMVDFTHILSHCHKLWRILSGLTYKLLLSFMVI